MNVCIRVCVYTVVVDCENVLLINFYTAIARFGLILLSLNNITILHI
jgi:hypothetical protein